MLCAALAASSDSVRSGFRPPSIDSRSRTLQERTRWGCFTWNMTDSASFCVHAEREDGRNRPSAARSTRDLSPPRETDPGRAPPVPPAGAPTRAAPPSGPRRLGTYGDDTCAWAAGVFHVEHTARARPSFGCSTWNNRPTESPPAPRNTRDILFARETAPRPGAVLPAPGSRPLVAPADPVPPAGGPGRAASRSAPAAPGYASCRHRRTSTGRPPARRAASRRKAQRFWRGSSSVTSRSSRSSANTSPASRCPTPRRSAAPASGREPPAGPPQPAAAPGPRHSRAPVRFTRSLQVASVSR